MCVVKFHLVKKKVLIVKFTIAIQHTMQVVPSFRPRMYYTVYMYTARRFLDYQVLLYDLMKFVCYLWCNSTSQIMYYVYLRFTHFRGDQ